MNDLMVKSNGISAAFGPQNSQAVVNVLVAAAERQLLSIRDEVRVKLKELAVNEAEARKEEQKAVHEFHKSTAVKVLEPAAALAEKFGLRSFGSETLHLTPSNAEGPTASARYGKRQGYYGNGSIEINVTLPVKLGKEPKDLLALRKKVKDVREEVLQNMERLGRCDDAIADMGRAQREAEAALVLNGVKGTKEGEELAKLVQSTMADIRKRIG